MDCNLCGKEIKKGERGIEVSYGQIYDIRGHLEVVGDHFEHFHTDCFKPTWRKKVWVILIGALNNQSESIAKGFDSKKKAENWIKEKGSGVKFLSRIKEIAVE